MSLKWGVGGGSPTTVTEMQCGFLFFVQVAIFIFYIFSPPADRHNFNIVCCLKNKAIN